MINPIPFMRAKLQQRVGELEKELANKREQLVVLDNLERDAAAMKRS